MNSKIMNTISVLSTLTRLAAVAVTASMLFGCAAVKLPPPEASASTVEKLRAAPLRKMTTGAFALATGKPAEMDQTLGGLRGSSLAPATGGFSQYLKSEIDVELKAAGLYDPASDTVVKGELTDSMVDASIGTGRGRLAARFMVDRASQRVFDKELSVDATWESSFVGAVALPMAINQYTSLYKSLVGRLFEDPAFRAAVAPAR